MRRLFYALTALLLFVQFSCGPTHVVVESPAPPPPPAPAPEVSYQHFYDALSPYGEWINNPEYGYVWMPNVAPDFKPYATNGNWVYTDEGWAWSSDYSWGWAPFHYGRWFYEDGYGWMWMPGNEWAPAWVTWRRSPDYYGWAPLGPGISISVAEGGSYNPPPHYWCFVPHQYVTSSHINNYYMGEQQNVTIVNNTTIIHNTTIVSNNRVTVNHYAGGPDPGEVSRVTGTQLRPIGVRETNTPGGNGGGGSFAVYRPRINAAPQNNGGNSGSAFHPAPSHVQTLTGVRPVNTNSYNNNFHPNSAPNNGGQPAGQTGGQSTYQPNRQPFQQPANQSQTATQSQPTNQSQLTNQSQPANQGLRGNQGQPAIQGQQGNQGQPAIQGQQGNQGQPVVKPNGQLTGQPANQPASHQNTTRFNGNANGGTANPRAGNPGGGSGGGSGNGSSGNGNNGSGGHGSGHPGQPGTNVNQPKPHPQQGPKPQDNQRKPKPKDPDNRS